MYPGKDALEFADRPAIIMAKSGRTVTYGEYEANSNRLAHLFEQSGLEYADHVAYFMENNARLFECEGAAERSGLYYTLVNSFLSPDEAAFIINDCLAKVVITSAAKLEVAVQLPALCPAVERWLIVDAVNDVPGFERYEEAIEPFPTTPIEHERMGQAMLYSSGTTGRPKGIYRGLVDAGPGDDQKTALSFAVDRWGFREGMVYLNPAPLYHSSPQSSVAAAIRLGATSVIMEKFDAAFFLELIEKYHVTHSQVVPTMFTRLLKLPDEVRTAADVSSLEFVIHAAAPCPVPVKYAMIEWLGPIIVEYAGTTEGMGMYTCNSEEWLAHPGTVGRPLFGDPVILDEEGNALPPGTPGVIWYPGADFEYFGDPEKTAAAYDPTGQMATAGDIGYFDADGYMYFTDRQSFMIISGGVNIYPQEIENLLITHPKVMDAAVIGVPNDDFGEEVKAVIEVVPGVEAGPELEKELIAFCAQKLARFKLPRSVDFVDELPRLATGKLYKRLLRDAYWADRPNALA
ncbi:AMP-binding protein [Subtercola endophyticus]|uniref:AMP-binding protein n=1 Tax=Subtercola endophyticus TaxID=2895559 RepID=UPI001E5589E0|nr:AMP-binding protein [Subtercola endophyticus]UFS58745.1 AMP-binding protein [Subtercola endophyticus]